MRPDDGRLERRALTVIYFLLAEGQQSAWHRVASDEVWHFHEGASLELRVAPPETDLAFARTFLIGPLATDVEPVRIVPAGQWQTARPIGAYALVSCSVAPGFEFEDFEMRTPVA